MKRLTVKMIEAQMAAAPVLVIPFESERRGGQPTREVPAAEKDSVQDGIIALGALAEFLLAVRFWWINFEMARQWRMAGGAARTSL